MELTQSNKDQGPGTTLEKLHLVIDDTDRYYTDKTEVDIALSSTVKGYSISFLTTAAQIGTATSNFYWHYNKDELDLAKNTFNEAVKVAQEIKKRVTENYLPHPLTTYMARAYLPMIDIEHTEKSSVPLYNNSLSIQTEPDPRSTIYGNRYPDNSKDIETYKQIAEYNSVDVPQGSGRGKVHKLIWTERKKDQA